MDRAVLDTCVLVPSRQRDFLLQLAAEGAYVPLWSTGTLAELDNTLAAIDAGRGREPRPACCARLLRAMRQAFPDSDIAAERDATYPYLLGDPR